VVINWPLTTDSLYVKRRIYYILNSSFHGGEDVNSLAPHNHALASDPESGWVKSSLSFANSNCVEVANLTGGQVGVRHSRHAENGPVLRFAPGEWHAFLGGVRNGEFDAFGAQRGPVA
jgi:hypothetical protein